MRNKLQTPKAKTCWCLCVSRWQIHEGLERVNKQCLYNIFGFKQKQKGEMYTESLNEPDTG